jgi:hypothetical protein
MTPLDFAKRELGVREIPGASDSDRIKGMLADVGHAEEPDETAWCAAFWARA